MLAFATGQYGQTDWNENLQKTQENLFSMHSTMRPSGPSKVNLQDFKSPSPKSGENKDKVIGKVLNKNGSKASII